MPFRRSSLVALCALICACVIPSAFAHGADTKLVRYEGTSVRVPKRWPVVRLTVRGTTCVRFDRHAVYLGTPSANQICPPSALGRTEAILLEPRAVSTATTPADAAVVNLSHRVRAVVTWRSDRTLVTHALGVSTLATTTATPASTGAPALPPVLRAPLPSLPAVVHAARATPAAAHDVAFSAGSGSYTGPGFDACSAPSAARMDAWQASPLRAIGVYIGGANSACAQPNLTSAWVSHVSSTGWHLVLTYVGLQAPNNSCHCASIAPNQAAVQGAEAADDAASHAQVLGVQAGRPVYFDMEGYSRTAKNTTSVLAFLSAWTTELHHDGYRSGVYSSAGSGIADLVAEAGTGYNEPDDLWFADWNGAATTSADYIPSGDWAGHRIHQYSGAHVSRYGGVSISIDSDYVAGDTTGPTGGAASIASVTAAPAPVTLVPVSTTATPTSGPGSAPGGTATPSATPEKKKTSPAPRRRRPTRRAAAVRQAARARRHRHHRVAPQPVAPQPVPAPRPVATPPQPVATPAPTPAPVTTPAPTLVDGDLIEVAGTGSVYRLVGGAPLFVRFWQDIGGQQPVITVSPVQFATLGAVPADGSVLDTQSGDGYIVAGGYPFALPDGTAVPSSAVLIDGWDLYHLGAPLAHLAGVPADGTVVQGEPSGQYWTFSGGQRTPAPASPAAAVVSDDALAGWPVNCAADPADCQNSGAGTGTGYRHPDGSAHLAADAVPSGLTTQP